MRAVIRYLPQCTLVLHALSYPMTHAVQAARVYPCRCSAGRVLVPGYRDNRCNPHGGLRHWDYRGWSSGGVCMRGRSSIAVMRRSEVCVCALAPFAMQIEKVENRPTYRCSIADQYWSCLSLKTEALVREGATALVCAWCR